jgi:hypothetical protein
MDNPMGKGSSVIMNRDQIKVFLDGRYDALIKKFGDFKFNIYSYKGSYFYHFIIPSESQRRNTYDVVVQFVNSDDPTEDFSGDATLKRYHVKLFSNCPSFSFTYAYVYNEDGRMVDMLQSKYSDVMLTNPPSTRNPGEIASFEKSTYFACKFISEHRTIIDKAYIKRHSSTDIKAMREKIRNTDTVMKEIAKENKRLEREGGNEGYVKVKKKTIKGTVADKGISKAAGVDKDSSTKRAIRQERKSSGTTNVVKAKRNTTHVTKPKPKIKATKSTVKKK